MGRVRTLGSAPCVMVMKFIWVMRACAAAIIALCFAAAFLEGANIAFAAAALR